MPSLLQKLKKKIEEEDNFLVLSHIDPDGDAVGTALALFWALNGLGKKAQVVLADPVPLAFSFLPGASLITRDFLLADFDYIITVDCGDLKQTGFAARLKEAIKRKKYLINLDHHQKNDLSKLSRLNYMDSAAPATAVLLVKLLKELEISLSPELATCLFCGLFTDTGGFRHANTTTEVLELTADLLNRGADARQVVSNLAKQRSFVQLKLWGRVLNRLVLKDGLAYSFVLQNDLADFGLKAQELNGLVNLLNTVPKARLAVLFVEQKDGLIKVSLRTEDLTFDVSALAARFGGGGHRRAAGFTIKGKIVKNIDGLKIIISFGPNRGQNIFNLLEQMFF
ncbi:DHH family phosphoesterase [Candidatus Berkelbacteria bacterium]|nr:DHH family phosphoesterase [Candidatus Berkelbacteria bacterium]